MRWGADQGHGNRLLPGVLRPRFKNPGYQLYPGTALPNTLEPLVAQSAPNFKRALAPN